MLLKSFLLYNVETITLRFSSSSHIYANLKKKITPIDELKFKIALIIIVKSVK
jgi:hypothetical protein